MIRFQANGLHRAHENVARPSNMLDIYIDRPGRAARQPPWLICLSDSRQRNPAAGIGNRTSLAGAIMLAAGGMMLAASVSAAAASNTSMLGEESPSPRHSQTPTDGLRKTGPIFLVSGGNILRPSAALAAIIASRSG